MSTMVISPEMLARIAYVTGASVEDLHTVHLANVDEYNAPDRRDLFETRKPNTLDEIRRESMRLCAYHLTKSFIEDTLLYAGLLRYNSTNLKDDAVHEALLRIESAGFFVFRALTSIGAHGFQADRRAAEREVEQEAEKALFREKRRAAQKAEVEGK